MPAVCVIRFICTEFKAIIHGSVDLKGVFGANRAMRTSHTTGRPKKLLKTGNSTLLFRHLVLFFMVSDKTHNKYSKDSFYSNSTIS